MTNYSMITEGMMKKAKEFMELNEDEKVIGQNPWDAMKAVLHIKFIKVRAQIKYSNDVPLSTG